MGFYLDSQNAYTLYKNETVKPYFVDKSQMLEELFPFVQEGSNYICITRPRRFGKTVMANMIASFYSSAYESEDIFNTLYIAKKGDYRKYLNQYYVIHISCNELPKNCRTYEQYIQRIEGRLVKDLKTKYPDVDFNEDESLWDIFSEIYVVHPDARFIFVLDEWDFIFHRDFVTENDKKNYVMFLSNLLKDKPYVLLAYMTGILPIAKYSSGSELNMFVEFTMAKNTAFSDFFGFTENEVEEICKRYLKNCSEPTITLEGLKSWYDGYHTITGKCLYNPCSVVQALRFNQLENYWTSSGPYGEIDG